MSQANNPKITKVISFTVETDFTLHVDSDETEESVLQNFLLNKYDLEKAVEISQRVGSIRIDEVQNYQG